MDKLHSLRSQAGARLSPGIETDDCRIIRTHYRVSMSERYATISQLWTQPSIQTPSFSSNSNNPQTLTCTNMPPYGCYNSSSPLSYLTTPPRSVVFMAFGTYPMKAVNNEPHRSKYQAFSLSNDKMLHVLAANC